MWSPPREFFGNEVVSIVWECRDLKKSIGLGRQQHSGRKHVLIVENFPPPICPPCGWGGLISTPMSQQGKVTFSFLPASNQKSHWGNSNIGGGTGCKTQGLANQWYGCKNTKSCAKHFHGLQNMFVCHAFSCLFKIWNFNKKAVDIRFTLHLNHAYLSLFWNWIARTSFDSSSCESLDISEQRSRNTDIWVRITESYVSCVDWPLWKTVTIDRAQFLRPLLLGGGGGYSDVWCLEFR